MQDQDIREILNHLMDIKERVSVVETKVDGLENKLDVHNRKVETVEKKVLKAEASLKTARRISYFLAITIPATAAAIAKILKP